MNKHVPFPENCLHILNPIALRMAKTPLSFGHSECNRVKKKANQDKQVNRYMHNIDTLILTMKIYELQLLKWGLIVD